MYEQEERSHETDYSILPSSVESRGGPNTTRLDFSKNLAHLIHSSRIKGRGRGRKGEKVLAYLGSLNNS